MVKIVPRTNNFYTEVEINFSKVSINLEDQYKHSDELRELLKKKSNKFGFDSSVDFN